MKDSNLEWLMLIVKLTEFTNAQEDKSFFIWGHFQRGLMEVESLVASFH